MQTAPWYAIPTMPMETGLGEEDENGAKTKDCYDALEEWWKSTEEKD